MENNCLQAICWEENNCIRILDQTLLPGKEKYLECRDMYAVIDAIKRLAIRGAPAIGIAASMALAIQAEQSDAPDSARFIEETKKNAAVISRARPTAVNLQWALDRLITKVSGHGEGDVDTLKSIMKKEALDIYREDLEINRGIGSQGQVVVPQQATVMTICNTGSLATGGHGTALGIIRTGIEAGKKLFVVACETRPLLQGARLTCWEMKKCGIPGTLITDSAAAYFMNLKGVDLIIIGADRIASNGDTANKIGSYSLAVLARHHGIPFYVAAPVSTIDFTIDSGDRIPIEERSAEEVTTIGGCFTAPQGVTVWNPAFDIVPAPLIAGIITEKGVMRYPFDKQIAQMDGNRQKNKQ